MRQRKIIHIDMDAFYASVEQLDDPSLRGLPVAVGHSGERGVVAAASYEARRYGVRSAMPSLRAKKLCRDLIFVPGRFDRYREISGMVMDIFHRYTDLVEPLSLDEAYLDVTTNFKDCPSATFIARYIKEDIKNVTGLTASAGVSYNKFLAKIASDYRKPDGLMVITPEQAAEFLNGLEVDKFHGVGKVTASKMHGLGIHTGSDIIRFGRDRMLERFGKPGGWYFDVASGRDEREVTPERDRKSVGAENTFSEDHLEDEFIRGQLEYLASKVWDRLSRKEFQGRTVTVKIKHFDFVQITRSRTYSSFVTSRDDLLDKAWEIYDTTGRGGKKIRLIGITVGNPESQSPFIKMDTQLRFPF